jgi:hypothetical protein
MDIPISDSDSSLPDLPDFSHRFVEDRSTPKPSLKSEERSSHAATEVIEISSGSDNDVINISDDSDDNRLTAKASKESKRANIHPKVSESENDENDAEFKVRSDSLFTDGAIFLNITQLLDLSFDIGSSWPTLEEAEAAICLEMERHGNRFRRSQSKRGPAGIKKLTLRCSCYGSYVPVHKLSVDPAEHREGRTGKTGCSAHININGSPLGGYSVTTIELDHNHPPTIPKGSFAVRPATAEQKALIGKLAQRGTFGRRPTKQVLSEAQPSARLTDRQISNIICRARGDAAHEIQQQGGDFMAIIRDIKSRNDKGEGKHFQFCGVSNVIQSLIRLVLGRAE